MRTAIITLLSILAGFPIACSLTGADKQMSAPVGDNCMAKAKETHTGTTTDSTLKRDAKKVFSIAMVGDIMMGTTFPDTVLPPDSGRCLFKDVSSVLRSADLAVGNLEGTLCDTGTTTKKKSAHNYSFRTPPAFASRLNEAGFDFLSMANNHSYDFGQAGIHSTEQALRQQGISFAGLRSQPHAAIVTRYGFKFGICAFGHNHYTLRHQDLSLVKTVLDSLRTKADIIIVSFHGGAEGAKMSHLPYGKETFLGEDRGSLRDFARFCIDHGADVVYGHGPHVVRCVEVYKGRFIAYSLGNFCTPYGINVSGLSGYAPLIEVRVDSAGLFVDGQIYSFIQRRGVGPRRDTTNTVARHIRSLTAEDMPHAGITINNEGKIRLKQ